MNIIHLTNNDFDGAGRAVLALHKALIQRGEHSQMLVYRKKSKVRGVVQICEGHPVSSIRDILRHKVASLVFIINKLRWRFCEIRWKPKSLFNFNIPFVSIRHLREFTVKADIIVLYSVQTFLSSGLIRSMLESTQAKLVWTPMDVEPLTGGCHFNDGCELFLRNCEQCPQVRSVKEGSIAEDNLRRKKLDLYKKDISFIAASQWVEDHIRRSSLFGGNKIVKIMLGIDKQCFKSADRNVARKRFNLPLDKKIILFGCFAVNDKRKGVRFLVKALKILEKNRIARGLNLDDVLMVTFGKLTQGFLSENIQIAHRHIGYISNDHDMALAYQSADVFVSSSIDDFGPRVIIESFMCGTPVVSFNIGVANDLIKHPLAGQLVKKGNVEQMAVAIEDCMQRKEVVQGNEQYVELKEICDEQYQAEKYVEFFKQLQFEQSCCNN